MIELRGVTLDRRSPDVHGNDLKRRVFAALRGNLRPLPLRRVLEDINLSVPPGEKLGIIGPNGAGKSTLLKVICGVLQPSAGSVAVSGRVAPVIEVGGGFDPELPVVENILFFGVLLGFSRRDMLSRVAGVLEFAGLEEYRNTPVRALSSGMVARLGFAIATDVDPDILIVDEALSVGDEKFRAKSQRRIDRMWSPDATVLVVSHDLQFIRRSCRRAVVMEHGRIVFDGLAEEAVTSYVNAVDARASDVLARGRALLRSR